MDKISVIVPVYKVEAYLPKCLDSILEQTYKNLEIILVDDGSPDNCPSICDNYAMRDNRIIVIHKTNGGLSSARNIGLDKCTGEYVIFIDSDDWMENSMIYELYNTLKTANVDIATCGITYIYEDHHEKTAQDSGKIEVHSKESFYRGLMDKSMNVRTEVWNKLWKRSVIGGQRFKVGQIYEDVYFDRVVLHNVEKIATIDKSLYYYRMFRPGSTLSTFNQKGLGVFDELGDLSKDVFEQGFTDVAYLFEREVLETAIGYYVSAVNNAIDKEKRKFIKNSFDKYYENKSYNPYLRQFKYRLFHLSPSCYMAFRKVRNLLMR